MPTRWCHLSRMGQTGRPLVRIHVKRAPFRRLSATFSTEYRQSSDLAAAPDSVVPRSRIGTGSEISGMVGNPARREPWAGSEPIAFSWRSRPLVCCMWAASHVSAAHFQFEAGSKGLLLRALPVPGCRPSHLLRLPMVTKPTNSPRGDCGGPLDQSGSFSVTARKSTVCPTATRPMRVTVP